MICGCTKYLDNKILKIEDMKNMPIDQIVSIYKDGYSIESMQYSSYCTGTSTLDRENTSYTGVLQLMLKEACAQRIKPTSKCLKNVTVALANIIYSNDMFFEIRKDSGGIPQGDPLSGGQLFRYRIPGSQIPEYPIGEITITTDLLLEDSDMTNGIWIVICSYFYDPDSTDLNSYHRTKVGNSGTSAEYLAYKIGRSPWEKRTAENLWFKTNKQAYSPPCTAPTTILTIPT